MNYIIITEFYHAYKREWWEERANKPVDDCDVVFAGNFDEAKKLMLRKIKEGAEAFGCLVEDGHCSAYGYFSIENYMEYLNDEEDIEYIANNEDLISIADTFLTSVLQGQTLPIDDIQGREAYFGDNEDYGLFFAVNDEQCSFHYNGENFDCNIRNIIDENKSYYFSYKNAENYDGTGRILSVKLIPVNN